MTTFTIPRQCTEKSVNTAFDDAGLPFYIYRHAAHDWRWCIAATVGGMNVDLRVMGWYDPKTARFAALTARSQLATLLREARRYDY
jgi:hypothetical protein